MFDFEALDEADAKSQKDKLGFKLEEFDGVDTRLAGKVDTSLLERPAKQGQDTRSLKSIRPVHRTLQGGQRGSRSAGASPTSDTNASDRENLLVRRGHAAWRELRYQDALADFQEGSALEAVAGPSSLSLLCLRFCLGTDLGHISGHEACKAMAEGITQLWCLCRERHARQLRILRPRKSMWDEDHDVRWAAENIQLFDGSCSVGEGADPAEIGYRLLMNRRAKATHNTLLILYHGNGEICEDYTDWADIYRVFPCSMLIFDYRGYGWSSGKPTMANLLSDAEQCMQKLPDIIRQNGLTWPWPAPVVLVGRSLGSAVATHLIGLMPDKFDGLILDSGFATSAAERYAQLLSWLRDSSEQAVAMFEELSKQLRASLPPGCKPGQESLRILGSEDFLRGYRGPVLLLHGEHDFIVGPENAKRHFDAAVHASQRELVMLDADHNTLAGVPDFWKKQMEFAKHLVDRKMAQKDLDRTQAG
ncbi:WAV2 [Symbiodinium natans]|uniref:WAV2 protein n=1 Tax=Symbiodinium natans TaxID=878477 RepID=A0A812S4F0_9DINO|nr:WAV2 [Symbiodinium natans]